MDWIDWGVVLFFCFVIIYLVVRGVRKLRGELKKESGGRK